MRWSRWLVGHAWPVLVVVGIPLLLIFSLNCNAHRIELGDNESLSMANATNESNHCAGIRSQTTANQCYRMLAGRLVDLQLCDELVEVGMWQEEYWDVMLDIPSFSPRVRVHNPRDDCKAEVRELITERAIASQDYGLCQGDVECEYTVTVHLNDNMRCDSLDEKRDQCILDIAKQTGNLSICQSINQSDTKQGCYLHFSAFIHDPELCTQIPEDKQPACFFEAGINRTDASYCAHAGEQGGECYFAIAKATNSTAYCLKSGPFEDECWTTFALLLGKEDFCGLSSDAGSCYYDLAWTSGDRTLCQKAGDRQSECGYRFAVEQQRPEICLTLDPKESFCMGPREGIACRQINDSVSSCIYMSSSTTGAYCQYIEKAYYRDRCYRNVGVDTLDTAMCDLAEGFRNNCYYEIALNQNRSGLCAEAGPWKEECRAKLQES